MLEFANHYPYYIGVGWRNIFNNNRKIFIFITFAYSCSLFVILNDEKTIREAFVKRGDEFANRSDNNIFQYIGYGDG